MYFSYRRSAVRASSTLSCTADCGARAHGHQACRLCCTLFPWGWVRWPRVETKDDRCREACSVRPHCLWSGTGQVGQRGQVVLRSTCLDVDAQQVRGQEAQRHLALPPPAVQLHLHTQGGTGRQARTRQGHPSVLADLAATAACLHRVAALRAKGVRTVPEASHRVHHLLRRQRDVDDAQVLLEAVPHKHAPHVHQVPAATTSDHQRPPPAAV